MKSLNKLLLLVLFLLSGVGQVLAADNHAVWQMGTTHGKVYFLGSIHMLKESDYPLPEVMQSVYKDSKTVVFEVDVTDENSLAVNQFIQEQGLCEQGKTLQDYVSAKAYRGIQHALAKLNQSTTVLDPFKPWLAITTLAVLDVEHAGFNSDLGVDKHLMKRAEKDGKGIAFFESAQDQIQMLQHAYEDDVSGKVLIGLDELTINGSDTLEKLVKFWQEGDADRAYKLISQSTGSEKYPDIELTLLNKRNEKWVPIIESLAKEEGNLLVVVGMGHLVGPHSVIQMLKDKGYHIQQL